MAIFTVQPFKATYLLCAILFELVRTPLCLVKYITSYGRPHPRWSLLQAFKTRLISSFVRHVSAIQVKTPLPLTPGKEKERFIVIDPAPLESYKGPLAPTEDVKPISIGASWYPAPLTPTSNTSSLTVVLHIHGGAYVIGDGRTKDSGFFFSKLLKHAGATHVLAPQYRLSSLPASKTSNPFPAAVQDSLTAYLYLVNTLKISPRNIVLSGDSAGANAAIAILRYLSEYGADVDIPTPSAAWLWSPWVNLIDSFGGKLQASSKYSTDYLSGSFVEWGAAAYAGPAGIDILKSPYISSRDRPFKTVVPLWITTGGAEVLYDEDKEFAEMMEKAGNNVTFDVEEIVPHDVLLMGAQLGFDKEASANAKRAGEWLKSLRK